MSTSAEVLHGKGKWLARCARKSPQENSGLRDPCLITQAPHGGTAAPKPGINLEGGRRGTERQELRKPTGLAPRTGASSKGATRGIPRLSRNAPGKDNSFGWLFGRRGSLTREPRRGCRGG